MSDICSTCGLPKELCVCETIARETQNVTIKIVKRRFGKLATVVEGLDPKNINIKELAKQLKSKLACGGTAKNGMIELQGKHVEKVKEQLIALGYSADAIAVKSR